MSQKTNLQGTKVKQSIVEDIQTFKNEGYLILENIFEPALIDLWYKEFIALLHQKMETFQKLNPATTKGNHDLFRWNMHIPTDSTMFISNLIAHPEVLAILKGIFEYDFVPVFIASDVACPGAVNQEIHQDGSEFTLAVNIPLVDVGEANAPTEVWAKTHQKNGKFSLEEVELDKQEIKNYVKKNPSKYLLMQKGSLSIRDMRMLHRGTENKNGETRPLLSIIYKAAEKKVPYRFFINFFVGWAKNLRVKAYRINRQELIDKANTLGRMCDLFAQSDRDYRRKITKKQYEKLSEEAKYLLRFADFEKGVKTQFPVRRSRRYSLFFCREMVFEILRFYKRYWFGR